MIIRTVKTKDYSIICNFALQDKGLSLKAKGLWAFIMTKPDNWSVNYRGLASQLKEGQQSILAAMKELEDFGYLVRGEIRADSGKFAQADTIVYEKPCVENPRVDNPRTKVITEQVKTETNNTPQFLGDEKKENSAKEKGAPKPADVLKVVISIINPREKPTTERIRLVNGRLKDYMASDITGAAHQLAKSQWHKENKQMSVDNLLAPSKFGRWYAQYTASTPLVTPPTLTREEMMRIDAEDAERRRNRDWGF